MMSKSKMPVASIREKNHAYILTSRCRYDRVEYVRVKKGEQGAKDSGYRIFYNVIGKRDKVRSIVEFIPDKWIVHMYKHR